MLCLLIKYCILLIAHNSDYGCRFILECLENVTSTVKGGRFLQIKATYHNPIKRKNIANNHKR